MKAEKDQENTLREPAKAGGDQRTDGGTAILSRLIARAPKLSSPATATARVNGWFAEIARTAPGKTIKRLSADHPTLLQLIEALAASAPYLWDLVRASPQRLATLLEDDPARRFERILSDARRAVMEARDDGEIMRLLRHMKADAALLIALGDIGGVWPIMQLIELQTRLADAAIGLAVDYLLADALRRGRLKMPDSSHLGQRSGYIVLAMGKMGANELNYSSDVDLIVFYDPAAVVPGIEPAALYVRLTRGLVKLLQERTSEGYVFRIDLRLRPDPASTQIAMSTAAALDYYESRGQNWERAALIKARPCAGDLAAGEKLLAELSPFIWRKYLDFASVADVHAMKRQIHAYRGHDEIAVEGHNIKLGRGGIREIEFFVQTQQLIAGGRNAALRMKATLSTLAALADGGWIDAATCADLQNAYQFLRTVEHRLQMVADEQTHTLPSRRDDLDGFARFLGYDDRDGLAQVLLRHLRAVQSRYASLFEHASLVAAERRRLTFPREADANETLAKLSEMGFRQPVVVSGTVRRWLAGHPRGLKGESAHAHFAELVPLLIDHVARAENPDAALAAFDRFVGNLHGGARLFSLLRQNPDLVALVARVLGTAPRLADTLALHPDVLDPLIDPAFFGTLPGPERLTAGLAAALAEADSYEDFLDGVRRFAQEQVFLIGARILSGTVSAQQAGQAFAAVADAIVRTLHAKVAEIVRASHGEVPGGDAVVLAMGKLGGREMTANSDLDLIVIYDFDPAHPE